MNKYELAVVVSAKIEDDEERTGSFHLLPVLNSCF